ncbi:hypothetical protein ILUMI_14940 [Ignelater luminosus]|uniref:Pacifastin domain-containing protein n=1 Tax=Ignelater luminosus TaxID=2038154 RepID=A0A8K0CPI9_IGNLU|nr:hypothetical protein ILUMI_14940 [Ignelater luminosus]
MKAVIFLGIFLFAAVLAVNASDDDDDFKCTVGVNYKENRCNNCFCSPTHTLGCTLMACQSHQDPKLTNCARGTTWEEGCEKCWCTKQGTICTTDCGRVHNVKY